MNVLLLASHAVAEYDDTRMFHDLGYDVFTPGGYEDPRAGTEGIRPPLPSVPFHADLAQRCQEQREAFGEPGYHIDWAKARLHDDVIDWADVIIVHHFPKVWIAEQWQRIRHKRVVWRTCGQSDPSTEAVMADLDGLEIVRYSPAERRYFEAMGCFAGETALIRFGKYPSDYGPWDGQGWDACDGETIGRTRDFEPRTVVGNVTQDMVARGDACGYGFWQAATEGLPVAPAGKGSEVIGGVGQLSYEAMLAYLRYIRVYLYTGTRPASYTLGLIEAMLSGVPVVSIGPRAWGADWGGVDLFEPQTSWYNDPADAHGALENYLRESDHAGMLGSAQRDIAVERFGIDTIGAQWREFLS